MTLSVFLGIAAAGNSPPAVVPDDRQLLGDALSAAHQFNDLEQGRLRRFRAVLFGAAFAIAVVLGCLAWVGVCIPTAVKMCVDVTQAASDQPANPPPMICATGGTEPSGRDVMLVVLLGVAGAVLAAVRNLAGRNQTGTRYSLVVAQALLKITSGGLVAVLGVLFIRAGLVPLILTAGRNGQAAILTAAVVFGYAQQLLTGMLDKRATTLLDSASPTTPAASTA